MTGTSGGELSGKPFLVCDTFRLRSWQVHFSRDAPEPHDGGFGGSESFDGGSLNTRVQKPFSWERPLADTRTTVCHEDLWS